MNRLIAVALSVCAVSLAAPSHAGADSRGCVTRKEFRIIDKGMTQNRVERIFGTHRYWVADGGAGGVQYVYQSCDMAHAAFVTYRVHYRSDGSQVLKFNGQKRWTTAS